MGMFDYVECQIDLPMPEDASAFEQICIDRFIKSSDFQTKDLDSVMAYYLVDENGLFREKIFSTGRPYIYEPSDPVYIHQHMICYGIVDVEEEKFWLEYDLKFTNGIMVDAKVIDWKKIEEK
jgi:hypothetical protein